MREVAFVKTPDIIRKLIIFQSEEGVYLFGYDCLQDTSAIWDNWYQELSDAEEYCMGNYHIDKADWIVIAEPCEECQHDFIQPTKVKGRETSNPLWGQLQTYVNGKWIDFTASDKLTSFGGLTGNERLFVTGLMDEFDRAKKQDRQKAKNILLALDFDESSISKIL